MRLLSSVLTFFVLCAPILAVPTTLKSVESFAGERNHGSYIIKLKPGVAKNNILKSLGEKATHQWDAALNGFAGKFSDRALKFLRASPLVESISEDGIMHIFQDSDVVTQTDAPWGLARISSPTTVEGPAAGLNFTYTYAPPAGEGVDVYVVDTGKIFQDFGVFTNHTQFGGRARWGATFGSYKDADGHGHGTHCAGTVAGSTYGVAKAANIIAVKVLSDGGSGSVADIVSGLNYVLDSYQASGRPTIVSMSLGGGRSTPLDNAVATLTAGGVHVVIAAGNSNTDAANTSPARAPSAITVGASNIADARASFSNYGAVVDVFAPGQDVISSWIGSDDATNKISGTSMATPHVAGLVAYLISVHGNKTPAEIEALVVELSSKDALTGIRE
ncbi:subtilisin-like serine protease [Pleurotus ostreatus]|uniref:Subtilisin-like serine protease n=1 Tax=Pleurotus ostreatus TaxID=5322 RepID=A0A8H6ZRG5_PLEOS|nr:subtilisin-like serine protease [Pleurotus ostreatus]KAF7422197.1 subtilisin-like serine protease [Pleurotus ostreatus]